MIVADLDDRGRGDADRLGHRADRPARRFMRGRLQRQCQDFLNQSGLERRYARRPGLVAQQTIDPLLHEAFPPAPHTGL